MLRALNPGILIDGMYGGLGGIESLPGSLIALFDTVWAIPIDDPSYKWKNGDICVRWWFKEKGRDLSFSRLIVIEWDLLLLKPVAQVYGQLRDDCNYAAIFGDYAHVKEIEWWWLQGPYGHEVGRLLEQMQTRGTVVSLENLSFAVMGGCVLCRRFLELFAAEETVSGFSNDELRLSVYSAFFDIPLQDNQFFKNPNNLFNANNDEYGEKDLDTALMTGGVVIHPLRVVINDIEKKFKPF